MEGRAFVFGDGVNTGYITPGEYVAKPMDEIVKHLFEPIRPEVAGELEDGDVIVGGENFGTGSSRETAPAALAHAGVSAVVAESFARIFYRNCIAVGLLPLESPSITDAVDDRDVLEVIPEDGVVRNRTAGEQLECLPLPPELEAVCSAGGLLAYYERHPEGLSFDNDHN